MRSRLTEKSQGADEESLYALGAGYPLRVSPFGFARSTAAYRADRLQPLRFSISAMAPAGARTFPSVMKKAKTSRGV